MNYFLETERLKFRHFTIEDAELLHNMHQDLAITKYVNDPEPWSSIAQAEKVLREIIIPQYDLKIGRWAIHLKETNEFIGWCGLKKVGDEIDLGYRFIQKYWGKSFATEAAQAVLDYGVKLNLPNIIGRAATENIGSIKVLEKIGLTFKEFTNDCDGPTAVYIWLK